MRHVLFPLLAAALSTCGSQPPPPSAPVQTPYGTCYATVPEALQAGHQEDSTCASAVDTETGRIIPAVPLWWIAPPFERAGRP